MTSSKKLGGRLDMEWPTLWMSKRFANRKLLEGEKIVKRSSWSLVKSEEFTDDIQEYLCQQRKALLETFIDLREGRNLSKEGDLHLVCQRNEAQ